MVSQLALGLPQDVSISGIGGIECSHDAIEFLLLGSSTVQLCTGVMLHGVKMIDELKEGLEKFMTDKGFNSVQDVVGKSLGYFSTHMDLVQKMTAKRARRVKPAVTMNGPKTSLKTAELTSN
jgi:dihydropyrimidine dehydrogenase (NADP+)